MKIKFLKEHFPGDHKPGQVVDVHDNCEYLVATGVAVEITDEEFEVLFKEQEFEGKKIEFENTIGKLEFEKEKAQVEYTEEEGVYLKSQTDLELKKQKLEMAEEELENKRKEFDSFLNPVILPPFVNPPPPPVKEKADPVIDKKAEVKPDEKKATGPGTKPDPKTDSKKTK